MRLPAPATLADRLVQLRHARPITAPGTTYHYFNANYQILARLVEVVSGEPFSTYLHRHEGTPYLERNGILSTFYAEMVLLPQTGQSFVLLSNIHSLAQDTIGAPAIKAGLINLLSGQAAPTGGFSVSGWAMLISLITLVRVGLEVRELWRLPRWWQQAASRPVWRPLLTSLWSFVPAGLVLAMPVLVLQSSGRAFGYLTLFRLMIDIMSWLMLCGVLGALNGLARLVWLLRRRTPVS